MTYRDEVLADNPVVYWNFEQSGSVTENGSLSGAPSVGTAVSLNQSSGSPTGNSATLPYSSTGGSHVSKTIPATVMDGSYSVEVWVKTAQADATLWMYADVPWAYGSVTGGGKLAFVHGYTVNGIETAQNINDNVWHHLVFTFDRSTLTAKLYVDGVLEATGTRPSDKFQTNRVMSMGEPRSIPYSPNGSMDDFAVYPVALSPQRIAAHFNPPVPQPPIEVMAGFAGVLQLRNLTGPTVEFTEPAEPAEPPLELLSGFATGLTFLPVQATVEKSQARLSLLSGFAGSLALRGTQVPTLDLGAQVFPPVEVLSGYQGRLRLESTLGPTLAKGIPVFDSQVIRTGYPGVMSLIGMGINAPTITDPVVIQYGQWFLDALLFKSGIEVTNPSASHEVINSRKRVKTELKARVRV
jgi:hypothetical protein